MEIDNATDLIKLTINVGSRKSQLALIQTHKVIQKLEEFYTNNPDQLERILSRRCGAKVHGINFNVITMSTTGDKIIDKPLPSIGTKSLFTRELEVALQDEQVDFVVHSLKDLPTTLPQGCCVGAVLRRDSPEDTIILKSSLKSQLNPTDLLFDRSRKKFKVGTSSHRRIAMIRSCNPNIECIDIRGNLNTRLAKLDRGEGEYDAIVLAKAGIDRMGWSDRSSLVLSSESDHRLSEWHYAVGQGAIAVECRDKDTFIIDLLMSIVDLRTTYEVIAERSLMKKIEAGCSVPLGVRSSWVGGTENEMYQLKAIVLSKDGRSKVGHVVETRLVGGGDHQISKEKEIDSNLGVVFSKDLADLSDILRKATICLGVGEKVAERLIGLGCLELMKS